MGVLHVVPAAKYVNYFQETTACRATFPVFWDPAVNSCTLDPAYPPGKAHGKGGTHASKMHVSLLLKQAGDSKRQS